MAPLAAAAAFACALAGAGSATAAAPPTAAGELVSDSAEQPAMTDRKGLLAYRAANGAIVVQDAATGARAEHHAGAACGGEVGGLLGMGGGQVLFACVRTVEPRSFAYLLLDVASGTVHVPVGADSRLAQARVSEDDAIHLTGVGAFGIAYSYELYHADYAGRFDWRTGVEAQASGRGDDRQVPDLDVPQLESTLCAPLRLTRDSGTGFLPYDYDPPYLAVARGRELVLQQCGRTDEVVLAHRAVYNFSVAGGFASWFEGTHRFAYLPSCGVRLRWAVPVYSNAEHVDGAIVTSERYRDHAPWRIRVVRLDGACERVVGARRLTVSAGAGAVATATAPRAAYVDPGSGGTAIYAADGGGAATVRVRDGGRISLRTGVPARYVRWRAPGGRLQAATGGGRRWTLRAPARARRVSVRVRFSTGGSARFAIRLTGAGR